MFRNLRSLFLVTVFQLGASASGNSTTPLQPYTDTSGNWVYLPDYSDEFNQSTLDTQKWNNNVADWGTWSWEPENAFVSDGSLKIRTQYAPHVRGGTTLHYTSGIIRTKAQPILHGYFEAKVRAAPRFPGIAPAFWAWKDTPAKWTEIDFFELTQYSWDVSIAHYNTHIFRHPDMDQSILPRRENATSTLPWDPREDFHIYGCEWNSSVIRWYVDGKLVRERVNDFFDQALDVAASMGLRAPLATTPSSTGFPSEMTVDYIRVWSLDAGNLSAPVCHANTASNITQSSADLCGTLWTNASATEVTAFWGETDGGRDASQWTNSQSSGNQSSGKITAPITGLAQDRSYWFRFRTIRGGITSWSEAGSFTTLFAASQYRNRMEIAFSVAGSSILQNFPVMVELPATFSYAECAAGDGSDIRFTDPTSALLLPSKCDTWDPNGISRFWVSIPKLQSVLATPEPGSIQAIHMHWGRNGGEPATVPRSQNPWTAGQSAVWHMGGSTAAYLDASPNNNHATLSSQNGEVDGPLGKGAVFNGSGQHFRVPHDVSHRLADTFTLSAVIRWDGGGPDFSRIISIDPTGNYLELMLNAGTIGVRYSAGGVNSSLWSGPCLTPGEWHHIVASWDGASRQLHCDGIRVALDSPAQPDRSAGYMGIAAQPQISTATPATYSFHGVIDDIRIESVARSADWVRAVSDNIHSNPTFSNKTDRSDVDEDNMPDWWEWTYLGGTSAQPESNDDGDAQTNLAEWIAGTLPNDSQSVFTAHLTPSQTNNSILKWPSVSGKRYQVFFNTNLNESGWDEMGDPIEATPPENSLPVDFSQARGFFRIMVLDP